MVGVECDMWMSVYLLLYFGIIEVVECGGCDVIFMVFYGCCGFGSLLIGSEM